MAGVVLKNTIMRLDEGGVKVGRFCCSSSSCKRQVFIFLWTILCHFHHKLLDDNLFMPIHMVCIKEIVFKLKNTLTTYYQFYYNKACQFTSFFFFFFFFCKLQIYQLMKVIVDMSINIKKKFM